MNSGHLVVDLLIIALLIAGISQFRTPKGARRGNWAAAFALLCSMAAVWIASPVLDVATVLSALLLGSAVGALVAARVTMIQIPAMVAFQHGAGGIAAFLVSYLELTRQGHDEMVVGIVSGLAGLVIGAATASGSMLASGKLGNKLKQTPTVLKGHNLILLAILLAIVVIAAMAGLAEPSARGPWLVAAATLSLVLGVVFAMRIGGADMPVLISFLNATAGLAAAFCGIIIQNRLLIVSGATVAASGSILTHVMCKAMNRGLSNVFVGMKHAGPSALAAKAAPAPSGTPVGAAKGAVRSEDTLNGMEKAVQVLSQAEKIIIIPGYGMALAQAQFATAALASTLERAGKQVCFAIHPVAGRMPGHMNVLLAEADVDYDKLREMDEINPEFGRTDAALVIGACDVVNSAAIEVEGTPISGMPILLAHEARHVVVCNLDERPGYSGVPNPLYTLPRTTMLLGDARTTLEDIVARLGAAKTKDAAPAEVDAETKATQVLTEARSVVIIPGYGMALAQAQFEVARLASKLQEMGKDVSFAIHPVAGRMPGHMNVLLAEADVSYDLLLEMDVVNPTFAQTDVALVVGASDVVNTAAIEVEGTPISGMPILLAHEARHVVVCNLDPRPGYSGVTNPLYTLPHTVMVLGDARERVASLLQRL